MFRIAKFPFLIALMIASGVADEKHYLPIMYGQCQIDEYLKYTIGKADSYEYIVTSNRTVTDDFDHETFMMRSVGSAANFHFRSGRKAHSFKPINLSTECETMGICDEVDAYPSDEIMDLVTDYMDNLEITHFVTVDDAGMLNTANEFCSVNRVRYKPKAAQDENNDWYFIVNTKIYKQEIRTYVCKISTRRLSIVASELQVSRLWKKECVQEYYYRSFKAISWNGTIINKMFKVPNYCSCVISRK